jgi:predicted hydrolase (HD superfamily)
LQPAHPGNSFIPIVKTRKTVTISRQRALDLLCSKMQSQNLRRHCLAVEAAMRGLAGYFRDDRQKRAEVDKIDEEKWGVVGLLHDGDYEQTKEDVSNHSLLMAQWVADLGEQDEDLLAGIQSHGASHRGQEPQNLMQWALFCCDELTGLIVATALVQPDKKLSGVTTEKVLDKFKSKNFAAGARREDILKCEEKLGIPLGEFVEIVLSAMKSVAGDLGL